MFKFAKIDKFTKAIKNYKPQLQFLKRDTKQILGIHSHLPKFNFSKNFRESKTNINPDDPFPKYDKKDFYDEQDLIINIGEKETFKGMLVICPTPIGNLNDISIRQYEALRNGDILACEDTRKTGKLLELVQLKKMKEKFYSEFGISFEEFLNRGGLDMTDEQLKKEFFKNPQESNTEAKSDENLNSESNQSEKVFKENFHNFYETENDVKKYKKFEERLNKMDEPVEIKENSNLNQTALEENKKSIYKNTKSFLKTKTSDEVNSLLNEGNFFDKLQKRVNNKIKKEKDPFGELDTLVKEVNLNFLEPDNKEFINQLKDKMEDKVASDFYTQVKDSEDFLSRKTVIENSSDDLKDYIEPLAEMYDEKMKLSYKLRTKAKYIMGMTKKYDKKKESEQDKENSETNEERSKEEILEEEMSLHMGLEENFFGAFKKKIKDEKDKKGRGLLIPFNQENEEAKIPKLIRAMKMGLRVVLVSDAGTPTISDPGHKLVREATKNGIIIEPLPGPSAVITALSACALPTDKFMFVGYLPKSPNEKVSKLEEVKKSGVTTVLFESPNRLKRTVETLVEIFGPRHEAYIGFELTKKFENHISGTLESIKETLDQKEDVRGEITMILGPFQKTKEELENEKNLNDEVKLEALEFAKKVIDTLDISDKELRKLLMEICNISSLKAGKIVNSVRNRESSLTTFLRQTGSKIDKVQPKPIEDFLTSEPEGEGKIKNIPKIIRRNKDKEKGAK
jgi:16S rRNA (cytidine1402-2'-O)-methyltransferase